MPMLSQTHRTTTKIMWYSRILMERIITSFGKFRLKGAIMREHFHELQIIVVSNLTGSVQKDTFQSDDHVKR